MGNCFGRCLSGKNSLRHSTDDQEEELFQEETSNNSFVFRIMKFKKKRRPNFVDNLLEGHDSSYSRLNQMNPANTNNSSDIQLQCLNAQSLMLAARETQYTRFLNQNDNNGSAIAITSSRASSSLDLEWEHEYGGGHINPLHSSWLFLPEDLAAKVAENSEDDDANDTDRQSGYSSITNLARNRSILFKIHQQQQQQQQQQLNQSLTNNNNDNVQIIKNVARTPSRTSWSHISTPESLEWDIDEEQQKQLRVEDDNLDHETLELLHEIEILKNKVLNETGEGLDFDFPKDEGS